MQPQAQTRKVPGRERPKGVSARPLKRKVHLTVGGKVQEWTYHFSGDGLKVRSPEGVSSYVSLSDLVHTGREYDEDSHPGLTPSLVKAYVQTVLLDGRTWNYAEHVGQVYLGGVIVHKDALTAKDENAASRRRYQLPLRVVFSREAPGQWLSIDDLGKRMCGLVEDSLYASRGPIVDLVASMLSDKLVEHDVALGDRAVRFRFVGDRTLWMPKVAVFTSEEAGWLLGTENRRILGGRVLAYPNDGPSRLRSRHSVPRNGCLIEVVDEAIFVEFCASRGCKPLLLRDMY